MSKLFICIKNNDYINIKILLLNNIDLSCINEYKQNYLQTLILYSENETKTLDIITTHWNKLKNLINDKDSGNLTALHYACLGQKYLIIKYLLSQPQININSQDSLLSSPLHLLLSKKNNTLDLNVISLFFKHSVYDIYLKDGFKENILHLCLKNQISDKIILFILDNYPDLIKTKTLLNSNLFLYAAKHKRHSFLIDRFVKFDISPFDLNDKDDSAINYFSKEDYTKLSQAEKDKINSFIEEYPIEDEKRKRI